MTETRMILVGLAVLAVMVLAAMLSIPAANAQDLSGQPGPVGWRVLP